MREFVPLTRRDTLPKPPHRGGVWDSLLSAQPDLTHEIATLSAQQIARATIAPVALTQFNKGPIKFDPVAAEPNRSPIPTVTELHDALLPPPAPVQLNREQAFHEPPMKEKGAILNLAFDFKEARTAERKNLIRRTIAQFIQDPEYCLTFYQTLREYEEINPEQLGGLFESLRVELSNRLISTSQEQTGEFLKSPPDMQEARLGTMLQVILPSMVRSNSDDENGFQERGAREGALAMRKIMRGLVKGTNSGDEIVQLMYSLAVGGLSLDSDLINTAVYGITSFACSDIFDIADPQAGRYLAASYAGSDDTFAKMTLLDYTTTILEKLYERNQGRLDGLRDIAMEKNSTFHDAIKVVTATLDPKKKEPAELRAADKLKARMAFLEDKSGTAIDSTEGLPEDQDVSQYTEEAAYPGNHVAGNYALRRLYNDLLSRNLMRQGQIEEPIVLIATPADGLLRNVELAHGSTTSLAENILRHVYGVGTGRTIQQEYIIENAFTYLKPSYEPSESGDYSQAEFTFHTTQTYPTRIVHMDMKIGRYVIPVLLGMDGHLHHVNGKPIVLDDDKRVLWEHAASAAYIKQVNRETRFPLIVNLSEGLERRVEADQVDEILSTLRPPIIPPEKYRELVIVRRSKHDLLESPEEAYGLSAFGNHVPIEDVQTGCGATSLFFNWGKSATTDVDLRVGNTTLPLKLDIHYNLVRADGSALQIDQQTKTWWESIILSHLSQLLTIPRSSEREPVEKTAELSSRQRRPVTTHRRKLPLNSHASARQSTFIERVNNDDEDPRKVPLHIVVPPGEHYLQTWNRMLGRDGATEETRQYTWVLPSDDAIAGFTLKKQPVTKKLPTALVDIASLHIV